VVKPRQPITYSCIQEVNASVVCISCCLSQSHKDLIRASILDVQENVDVTRLAENTQIVAEALARHIFNLTRGEVFSSTLVSDICQVTDLVSLIFKIV
jgi:hypothetical protein